MKRVLVPLDGSPRSESILPAAFRLASAMGAEIALLHAVERSAPGEIHGERHLQDAASAAAYLERVAGAVPAGVTATWHVHEAPSDDAAEAIAEHVDELKSDIVILATHGKNRFGRFLHGSVAQRALFRGGAPVLTIPADSCAGLDLCRTVIAAVEGSECHGVPFAEISLLARALGASVKLVSAVDVRQSLRGGAASFARARPATSSAVLAATVLAAEEYLRAAAAAPSLGGIEVEPVVLRGAPERVLASYARRFKSSVFVIQTHGKSGLGAFWDGSAAARIVARLAGPVLLVPTERA